MEASGRQLPLASPSGQLVHTMQEVKQNQAYAPGPISYLTGGVVGFRMVAEEGEEHYTFPKGLKLGLVYDMMIISPWSDYREWTLHFETGVKDPLEVARFMSAVCSVDGELVMSSEVISHWEHKAHCAVMLIGTSERWEHYEGPDRELWRPEGLGEDYSCCTDFRWLRKKE
jgi:hypothetical protein